MNCDSRMLGTFPNSAEDAKEASACEPAVPYWVEYTDVVTDDGGHQLRGINGNAFYVNETIGEDFRPGTTGKIYQDTTIRVEKRYYKSLSFFADGAYLETPYQSTTNQNSITYQCYTYNIEDNCNVNNVYVPTITRGDGYNTVDNYYSRSRKYGDTTIYDLDQSTMNNINNHIGDNVGTITLQNIVHPTTGEIVTTSKEIHTRTTKDIFLTLNPNGNPSISPSTLSCTLSGTMTGCRVTLPDFTASTNTQTKIGWSAIADGLTLHNKNPYYKNNYSSIDKQYWVYQPGDDYTITDGENVIYAHSQAEGKSYTATLKYPDRNSSTNCGIITTYNGNPQATSCRITLPSTTITGYKYTRWSDGNNIYDGGTSYSLTKDTTFNYSGTLSRTR